MPNKLKQFYENFKHPIQMFGLYLATTALDFLSSLNFPLGFVEQNAFARHIDGSFWPAHACIQNGLYALEHIIVAVGVYKGLRPLNLQWAKIAAGLPFLYAGYGHLEAALYNTLIKWPGLYVFIPGLR